jgi:FMN reductase
MSGVMKNQMDWITNDIARGKPFGLVSTLGGASNSNTLNHMRISIRNLHGWVIPEQVAVAHVKDAFDDAGALVDEAMRERVEGFSIALVAATELLATTR